MRFLSFSRMFMVVGFVVSAATTLKCLGILLMVFFTLHLLTKVGFVLFCLRYILWIMRGERTIREYCRKRGVTISPNPNKGKEYDVNDYDIIVRNKKMWRMWILGGDMGIGDSFVDGYWEVREQSHWSDVYARLRRIQKNERRDRFHLFWSYNMLVGYFMFNTLNLQTVTVSKIVGKFHYDFGNEHFEGFLDPWMQYSCGIWDTGATNLEEAQIAKMDLIAEKLHLKEGDRVLDIGCGWGTLLKYITKKYPGVKCTGISISKEQVKYAKDHDEGLGVEYLFCDYRKYNPKEKFDKILSIEVIEHIGVDFYTIFFKKIRSLLKEDGLCLIQEIGSRMTTKVRSLTWFCRHIFPNAMIGSNTQTTKGIEESGMVIEDWSNHGINYYHTLLAWLQNLRGREDWHKEKYGERDFRRWMYYISFCAGEFKSRRYQDWHIVLSKHGVEGGYKPVRRKIVEN